MPKKNPPSDPLLFETPVEACRFLLVIEPTPETSAFVMDAKQALRERVGKFSGMHSIPHITLFFADLPVHFERDLVQGIAGGCLGQRPFELDYSGIMHFPDKKTIYIDPVQKDAIAVLRKNIVSHVRAFKAIKQLGLRATDHPHLTIAAGLDPGQFEQAWTMLAPHAFSGTQKVFDVVLLRRELKPGAMYQRVRIFSFQPPI